MFIIVNKVTSWAEFARKMLLFLSYMTGINEEKRARKTEGNK